MNIPKNLILDACMAKQNELIASFQNRLEAMKLDAIKVNHSPSQTENRGAGKIELLNAVGNELDFALREMEFLKTLNPEKGNTIVEPGALVITDKLTLYISVSIEQIEVQGHSIFGISVKAPIYAVMRGLESGSTFSFNETVYKIKAIY